MFFQSPDTIQINQSPRRERNFQRLGSLQTLEPGYPSPAEGQNQNCDCGRVPLALGFLLQLLDDQSVPLEGDQKKQFLTKFRFDKNSF